MAAAARSTSWRLTVIALLGLVSLPETGVASEKVIISTGKARGSYYYIGQRLKSEYILRQGQLAEVRTSRGSLHNLSLLVDPESPVNVALAQADALDLYFSETPKVIDEVVVIGDAGRECAYVIVAKDGPKSAAELKTGKGKISVDDISSGAEVTWRRMTQLEPAFAATAADSVPTMEGLLQLDAGRKFTDLRAVLVVSRPRRASPPLRHVLERPGSYRFLPILSSDLPNSKLPKGRDVYTFERVRVGGSSNKQNVEVDTLCTRGLILASKRKLGYQLRTQISEMMVEMGDSIVGSDE